MQTALKVSGRVLVTRPQLGAGRTAEQLRQLGFEPLVMPLTEVVALTPDLGRLGEAFDAGAVTSANALRLAPPALIDRLKAKPLHAVGEATAKVARGLGLRVEPDVSGTARQLGAMLATRFGNGARVLYPCGRVRLPDFEAVLVQAGIAVEPVETYDTPDRQPSDQEIAALIAKPPAVCLLHSRVAAQRLGALCAAPEIAAALAGTIACCLAPRVADGLPSAMRAKARIAATPDEASLLATLTAA